MSNPDNAETQATAGKTESFETTVNTVVKQMAKTEAGVWQLPDGIEDESVRFAANAERRRRDTESALSRAQAKLIVSETVNASLKKQVVAGSGLGLSEDQLSELEELKHSDPDAWRGKLNDHERVAQAALQTGIESTEKEAKQSVEVERRGTVLRRFNAEHPGAEIDDATLVNDIPPRISAKLESGEASFEEFLTEAHTYLTAGKTTKQKPVVADTNLGALGGSANPSEEAKQGDSATSYNDEVF